MSRATPITTKSAERERVVAEPSVAEYVVKNRLQAGDQTIHNWYRFVLGYPPHLVREYLDRLGADPQRDLVLDPFCGTATTPVEARLQGFGTLACDANPISILATRVKLGWDVDTEAVEAATDDVLSLAEACLNGASHKLAAWVGGQRLLFAPHMAASGSRAVRLDTGGFDPQALLRPEASALIPQGFISDRPLHRVLALRYAVETITAPGAVRDFLTLALANTIVSTAGNVGFGPEVYRLPPKYDADALGAFAVTVATMVDDLRSVVERFPCPFPAAQVFQEDARLLSALRGCPPAGIVITSPPYPNEKDYTRSTRLESVLLGLIRTKADLRALKARLLRSNTRNVFANDDDDAYVRDIPSVVRVAEAIEARRVELGKTSGFERQYHRVARLYFGGMFRHLAALLPGLRPGARCAYVVGDQMSFFRIHIRTAHLLADVAIKAGYKVEGIELWRTRRSTTTGLDLEENVLILKAPD